MHALRDRLPFEESAQLAVQLQTLVIIRGWPRRHARPPGCGSLLSDPRPLRRRLQREVLTRIAHALRPGDVLDGSAVTGRTTTSR